MARAGRFVRAAVAAGVLSTPLVACFDWSSLSSLCGAPLSAAYVVPGHSHTCARTTDGALFCWGDNRHGQLGTGDTVAHAAPTRVPISGGAARIYLPTGDGEYTSETGAFTCVQTAAGALLCWGDNTYGQLGTGDLKARSSADTSSPALTDAQSVFAGETFACATTKKGALECWGDNRYGELGVGDTSARSKPTAVPPGTLGLTAGGAGVTAMSAGGDHACAIAAGGVWCWGDNTYGELGTSSASSKVTTSPTAVAGIGCP